jgi:hypothetical protein
LTALGQQVRLCVPPDFKEWIEGLGLPVTPIGPELRKAAVTIRGLWVLNWQEELKTAARRS